MKPKYLVFTLYFMTCTAICAQDFRQYEPSDSHPYGQPNPAAPDQIKDWEPMIGRCDCISETRNQDGSWAEPQPLIWTFKYILNGMGVQDETHKADGTAAGSIRQYNVDSAAWYVHYYSTAAASPTLMAWEGNLTDEEDKIILYKEQTAPNGMEGFYRITFSDFTAQGYNWIGEWVSPDETILYPTWKISCSRSED